MQNYNDKRSIASQANFNGTIVYDKNNKNIMFVLNLKVLLTLKSVIWDEKSDLRGQLRGKFKWGSTIPNCSCETH